MKKNALRQSARDQDCTLRVPGVCNHDPATTVLAHLDSRQKGVGFKSPDLFACFACYACHAWLDGHHGTAEQRAQFSLDALMETQYRWLQSGLIVLSTKG